MLSRDLSDTECDVPDETESADLKRVYAYNGYYNRSNNKKEMCEKNTYYENLKDFMDEQLCSVAAQIAKKKELTD